MSNTKSSRRRDRRAHHAADPARSARLTRLLAAVRAPGEHSSLALIRAARIVALSAAVSELRVRGAAISCRRRDGVWYYRLDRA